jgi:hypothetical protein
MPSADISYHQPSRGSRALVVGLSIGVVLLTGWIVTANRESLHIPGLAAAPAPEPTQAPAPPETVVAAPAPEAVPPEASVTAEAEPPEPVVVASADPAATFANTAVAAPAIDPDVTGTAEAKFGPGEAVPLPHKRPQLKMTAALPVPRPRPDLGDAAPASAGRDLTDAEIERMR